MSLLSALGTCGAAGAALLLFALMTLLFVGISPDSAMALRGEGGADSHMQQTVRRVPPVS